MNFSTKVEISKSEIQIDYRSNLAFFGSCFADSISRRFADRKFNVFVNPLGVIYNPLSIENMFSTIAGERVAGTEKIFTEQDVFFDGERWNCYDAHGSLSVKGTAISDGAAGQQECIEGLNRAVTEARQSIAKADVVFITLGTAFVYFLKETGKVVSNCHKQRSDLFERRLISVEEAAEALRNICHWILRSAQNDDGTAHNAERTDQKGAQIVFTVSPLRHLNDGAHGNNLSKATLHLAIEKVCQEFADTAGGNCPAVSYFPSYEIVMDELRDYRFYAEDMIHLSAIAEDYIFERMISTYCTDQTCANIKQVEKFMKTASHRIIDADSARTAEMARQQIAKAEELEKQIAGLDLSKEKEHFRKFGAV